MGEVGTVVPESSVTQKKARKKIKQIVVVEGKYDVARVAEILDGVILATNGFGVFKNRETRELISRLGNEFGVVILTDSDGAGMKIRNAVKQLVLPEKVKHVYLPEIFGKEKRKAHPSKEGKVGVEGTPASVIEEALEKQGIFTEMVRESPITKTDLYEWGLLGGDNSAQKRADLQKKLNLPGQLSTNALIQVLNALCTKDELLNYLK